MVKLVGILFVWFYGGATVGLLMTLASRFSANRRRNNRRLNYYIRLKDCCYTCTAERSRLRSKPRPSPSLPSFIFPEDEDVGVDGSLVLHRCNNQVLMTVNVPPGFQLSLDFLPCFLERTKENRYVNGWVLGSSNGLLLCSTHKNHPGKWCGVQYYLCDPVNKQWIALPLTPKSMCVEYLGFVFDPCINFGNPDLHQPMPCKEACRFMVLRIPLMPTLFEVEIFSSDVGQWSTASLPSPHMFPYSSPGSLLHNGCLHWIARGHCVVYDPYNNNIRGLIPLPPCSQACHGGSDSDLALSGGSIWPFELSWNSLLLRCWELKGYDSETNGQFDPDKCYWFAHRLCDLIEIIGLLASFARLLAVHPHDPEIVYLEVTGDCNHHSFSFPSSLTILLITKPI